MRSNHREHLMLDQQVQGTLMKRVTTYWFFSIVAVIAMSWVWAMFTGVTHADWVSDRLWPLMPAAIGSFVCLPLAWIDMLRLSNRFVAPVHSLRTAIRRTLLGDDVPPVQHRKTDFWHDLISQFNRLTSHSTINIPVDGIQSENVEASDESDAEKFVDESRETITL